MNQPILVTGGRGTPGRAVVARLLAGGHLAPDRAVGRRTWEQFPAERVGRGRRPAGAEPATAEGRA